MINQVIVLLVSFHVNLNYIRDAYQMHKFLRVWILQKLQFSALPNCNGGGVGHNVRQRKILWRLTY